MGRQRQVNVGDWRGASHQQSNSQRTHQASLSKAWCSDPHPSCDDRCSRQDHSTMKPPCGAEHMAFATGQKHRFHRQPLTSDLPRSTDILGRSACLKRARRGPNRYRSYVTHPLWKATNRHPQTSSCRRVIRRGEASAHDPNSLKTRPSNDALLLRLEGPRNR